MPLKHLTETGFVFLLGAVMIFTGVVLDTLPLLPEGALPWAIAFGLSMLYALVLYPILKRDRAEYSFRVLHFLPAGLLVFWLILQIIAMREPRALEAHALYTWGWSLLPVGIGFFLLVRFCLLVIRRRGTRLLLLAALFVPFAALAIVGEQVYPWDQKLSAFLWQGTWWNVLGSPEPNAPSEIAQENSNGNLAPSTDSREEAWRRRLREMEERRREVAREREQRTSSTSVPSSSSVRTRIGSARSSSRAIAQVKVPPPKLPSSGAGVEGLAIFLLAGYCAVLHRRQENVA